MQNWLRLFTILKMFLFCGVIVLIPRLHAQQNRCVDNVFPGLKSSLSTEVVQWSQQIARVGFGLKENIYKEHPTVLSMGLPFADLPILVFPEGSSLENALFLDNGSTVNVGFRVVIPNRPSRQYSIVVNRVTNKYSMSVVGHPTLNRSGEYIAHFLLADMIAPKLNAPIKSENRKFRLVEFHDGVAFYTYLALFNQNDDKNPIVKTLLPTDENIRYALIDGRFLVAENKDSKIGLINLTPYLESAGRAVHTISSIFVVPANSNGSGRPTWTDHQLEGGSFENNLRQFFYGPSPAGTQ